VEEDHASSGSGAKKAKKSEQKKSSPSVVREKENISPASVTAFTMDESETSSLRKPTASQLSSRACDVDLRGGRAQQVLQMFDQQREKYENHITDDRRKTEAELSKSRRDASFYQDKMNLWSVLQLR
jgi:hypothetical protein